MELTRASYFKRQATMKEIGEEGQKLLRGAKVLVIGCGGLGSPVAVYLATSGIGELHLVDFDKISVSNLHRQVFYKVEDVSLPKPAVLAKEIQLRAPFTKVTFSNKAVQKEGIRELISKYDVIVDGTDNLPVKYLINDACVLSEKPLVYGSLYKFDGYVATFNILQKNGKYSCNLRDAFPKIATDIPNCEEAGTMNPIVGLIAMLQTNEVIKIITKTGEPLIDKLLIYNVLQNSQLKINLKKNEALNIEKLFESSNYTNVACLNQDINLLISSNELKEQIDLKTVEVISVVDDLKKSLPFEAKHEIPYKKFDVTAFLPDTNKKYVVVCNKGITSYDITLKLKEQYPLLEVFSLSNGLEGYLSEY